MDRKLTDIIYSLKFPITLVIVIWAMEIYETVTHTFLSKLGVYPREWDGLVGIFTSPYIHSDFEHLISNTVPLFVLTTIMVFFYQRVAIASYITIQLLTGIAVWLFARPSYHIGASGVVYGLVAFVFWSGIFRRNIKSIVLALIVVILYSGYFHGIVPTKEGVSWESHLFGGIVGIFTAFLFKDLKEEGEEKISPWEEDEEGSYFLSSDTFEKTKLQRIIEEQQRLEESDWTQNNTL